VIAAAAGVNQSLVFYHFGSVNDLIDAACQEATTRRVALRTNQLGTISSIGELIELGRLLHAQERESGNVSVLAQVLAGAQLDPKLAEAARHALQLWVAEIEGALERALKGSPIAELASFLGMARVIAAALLGVELYAGVDPEAAESALVSLEALGLLAQVVEGLGPAARYELRARLQRGGHPPWA
jgi:AcrR family transcriptional regulator